jgi:hypothetical protein
MSSKCQSIDKKRKSETKFQEKWLTNKEFNEWLVKRDNSTAYCNYCKREFTVKWSGLSAINHHKDSDLHQKNFNSIKTNQTLNQFVVKTNSSEDEEIAISELCLTYHTVCHHLSYRSQDCSIKLNKQLFKDSKICQQIHCGRTKMEALAENILSPLSLEKHLSELKEKKYSIASDASNKGNTKLFPIGIQYFSVNEGIVNFVLNFY